MSIFTISDHHFGHKKILIFEKEYRPFIDVQEMEYEYIKLWNQTVKKEDFVIYCGDFGFGSVEYLSSVLSQLNGHKLLIKGNHDRSHASMRKIGFEDVMSELYCQDILFTHKPRPYHQWKKANWNIHGHIHSKKIEDISEFKKLKKYQQRRYKNVSVEALGGVPYKLG